MFAHALALPSPFAGVRRAINDLLSLMGSLSDVMEKRVLDLILGQTSPAAMGTVYIALYTANPTDANASGTEVTGGSYARVAVTNNTTNFPAATGTAPTSKSNATAIVFPAPTANWGVITGFAVYDAATVGNEVLWGALTASKTVNNGDAAPQFAIGALVVTLD